jgi:Ca-activated chloride channel family protein
VTFGAPGRLIFLLAIPLAIAAYLWFERQRAGRAAAWGSPELLPNMVQARPGWRRHLPIALLLVGLAAFLVAFARPLRATHVKRQDATVVLVLDVSGSMAANDVPPSRIAVERAVAQRFVDGLPKGYRMSVVVFSDHSAVIAPPTSDLVQVHRAIAQARTGPQGTALGGGLSNAVDVARSVGAGPGIKRPPSLIVVMSDGGQTVGRISPKQALAKAQKANVPVSTVVIGTPDGVVSQQLQGGYTEQIEVPVEPALMQRFAQATGGDFFQDPATVDVNKIYRDLGTRLGTRAKTVEITAEVAAAGALVALVAALCSGLWFRRLA